MYYTLKLEYFSPYNQFPIVLDYILFLYPYIRTSALRFNRLKECYPGIFEHHGDLISIDSRHKKVLIMQIIAEKYKLDHSQIMFIDDSYTEVMEGFDKGFFSMHTTEVMERFNNGVDIS